MIVCNTVNMKPNYDPDVLDSLLAQHQNSWYARGCAVGNLVQQLEEGQFRTKLIGYMNLSVVELGHAPIIAAVHETVGIDIRSDTLGRHRRRICSCPDEVYS